MVNAIRRAPPSPPSSRSRRAATFDALDAVESVSVGAVTWNSSEPASSDAVRRSTLRLNAPTVHGCTSPFPTGRNQPYAR